MTNGVIDHYSAIIEKQKSNASECFGSDEAKATFLRCHNFLNDISVLQGVLGERIEGYCVDVAISEYQFALSALLNGHYRHAFGALRLTSEMLFHGVYFSGHEVNFRQWKRGERDLTWSALMDGDKGVFSTSFVRAFQPDLSGLCKKYSSLAESAYRECSEFVHGNPKKTNQLSTELKFNQDLLAMWEERMQSLRLAILFCYLYRFADDVIKSSDAKPKELFLDAFGSEPAVRLIFDGGVK